MKSTFFLFALLLPFFLLAQSQEGEVFFTETIQLNLDTPDDLPDDMKGMSPSVQSVLKTLIFNQQASLYQNQEGAGNEPLEVRHEADDMDFDIKIERPENIYYFDLNNGTFINKREFFGRQFLINGDTRKYAWKLTGEQKKIGEYICQKATCTDGDREITAWFTPQINVPAGPDDFNGLPGLILEVDINNGERVITANKIELKPVAKNTLVAPAKGKKISQEEFDKIKEEKMKEMEAETGGGGIRMIIRN